MRPSILVLTAFLGACIGGGPTTTPQAVSTTASTPTPARATATSPRPDTSGPVTDARGDVADPSGRPPDEPVAAADLLAVEVAVTDVELVVRFHLAGSPPQQVDSLLWSVRTQRAGEPVLTISAQQVGPELFGAVYDWADRTQRQLPVEVDGPTVTVRAPRSAVDDPGDSWSALVQLDGAYEDSTPEVPLHR